MPHRFRYSEAWSRELMEAAPRLGRCYNHKLVRENDMLVVAGKYTVGDEEHTLPATPVTSRVALPVEVAAAAAEAAEAPPPRVEETEVAVALMDTLSAALMVENCAALNFANAYTPGGGYRRGSQAQEEDLCRLIPQLITTLEAAKYPIEPHECLVTRDLPAIREIGTYQLCACKGTVNILTAAMPMGLEDTETGTEQEWYETVRLRMRAVLQAAKTSGFPNLVLGAWGCGAFGNPPIAVARLFKETLCLEEFRGCFGKIVFAIVDPRGDGNFEPFREEISKIV